MSILRPKQMVIQLLAIKLFQSVFATKYLLLNYLSAHYPQIQTKSVYVYMFLSVSSVITSLMYLDDRRILR